MSRGFAGRRAPERGASRAGAASSGFASRGAPSRAARLRGAALLLAVVTASGCVPAATAVAGNAVKQATGVRAHATDARRVPAEHGWAGLAAATGPVSRLMGARETGYWVTRAGRTLVARDSRQDLSTSFTASGVWVRNGRLVAGVALREARIGRQRLMLRRAAPRVAANRVSYRRGLLREWYANGPLGLEQGFTLTRPPLAAAELAGHHGEVLSLILAASGNAQVRKTASGFVIDVPEELSTAWKLVDGSRVEVSPAVEEATMARPQIRYASVAEALQAFRETLPLHEGAYRELAK